MAQTLYLFQFESTDHLLLPGLLYEPSKKTGKVALYLHGNGSSSIFYDAKPMNIAMATYLNALLSSKKNAPNQTYLHLE